MIKKMSKKILAMVITLAMVISLMPTLTLTASAAAKPGSTDIFSADEVLVGSTEVMTRYDVPLFYKFVPKATDEYIITTSDSPNGESGVYYLGTLHGTADPESVLKQGGDLSDHVTINYVLTENTIYYIGLTNDSKPSNACMLNIKTANTAPTFVGSTTAITVAKNSGDVDLKKLLHVSDTDNGQTLEWSQSVAPNHGGTLSFSTTTNSSGPTDITSLGAITYKPAADYTGDETLTVKVSDGTDTATRQVTVTVTDATSSYLVNTTADSGAGSLRQGLVYAGENPNCTITFADSLKGQTITLASDLTTWDVGATCSNTLGGGSGSFTLTGLTNADGTPAITINGGGHSGIWASGSGTFSVSNLMFTNFALTSNGDYDGLGAVLGTGGYYTNVNLSNVICNSNTVQVKNNGGVVSLNASESPYDVSVSRCIFSNNTMSATDTGTNGTNCPAVYVNIAEKTSITNSLFCNNTFTAVNNTYAYGCAFYANTGGADLFNNTFYNNTINHAIGTSVGAAVAVYESTTTAVNLYNNIMVGNTAGGSDSTYYTNNGIGGNAAFYHGNNLLTGTASDIFTNAASGDFTLKSTATGAIDTGDDTHIGGDHDLAGNDRKIGAHVDIGAYEYLVTNTAPTVTGVDITGTAMVGNTLTGSYSYSDSENDAQGTSTFKWYRADDTAGTNEAAISGETGTTYILTSSDLNKNIRFEVTPVAAAGTSPGTAVKSNYTAKIAAAGPTFTSGTGTNFAENAISSAYTAAATPSTGGGTVSYSIDSGADKALFNIDSSTGAVTFKTSPDYEKPTDSGNNNVYDITVKAKDSNGSITQNIAITVTNVNEVPTADFGKALTFNGTNERIDIPTNSEYRFSGSSDYTISMWIYPRGNTGGNKTLYRQRSNGTSTCGMWLVYNNGKINFNIENSVSWVNNSGNTSLNQDEWSHVALVKSGSSIKTYINGVQDISFTLDAEHIAALSSTGNLSIGGDPAEGNWFNGTIDEFEIFSTALSQATIANWMYHEVDLTHPNYSNLKLYYKFNDGNATSAKDFVGANNGSFVAMDASNYINSTVRSWTTNEDTPISGYLVGSDEDGNSGLTYSIVTNGTKGTAAIVSGNAFTYTPNANANGADSFTYSVTDGSVSTGTQTVNISITAVNDAPTGKPTITGTASVGSTLSASAGGIGDVDGLGTFSYKWQVSENGTDTWSDISGATNSSYTVTTGEAGKYVRIAVSFTDGGSTAETVYSDAFGPNKTSQSALVYADVEKTYGDAKFPYAATGGSGTGAVTYASSDTSVATISASTGEVTILKAGETTLTATKAGDTTYTEAVKSCKLTVKKAVLTATVGDYTKTYGDENPSFTVSVTGFVNSEKAETLALADYTAPTTSCDADTTTGVGTSSITISGGAATNYTFDVTDTGTLTINPKSLAFDLEADGREYDGTTSCTGKIKLNGVINSDDVTATGTFAFETAGVADGKDVYVTGITLSGTKKDNYYLYPGIPNLTKADIKPKSVSIASVTISDKVYSAGSTSAVISSASLSGKVGTEDVSLDFSGATATFTSDSVGNGKTVNVTGLTLKGADKNNYNLISGSYTASGNIINDGTVSTPTTDTAAGAVAPGKLVTLSCATVDAKIYYTINGIEPTESSAVYSAPIPVNGPITIKAKAFLTGKNGSEVLTLNYAMASTVTAHNSVELSTYIASPYVSTINLEKTGDYTYNGAAITRALTINGNGATVNIGTGVDATVIKMTSGAVPAATGKVFLEVSGNLLTISNVTLQNGANSILCAINVKTGGSLYLDGVSFKGFYANSNDTTDTAAANCVNNFGVHAEPLAESTTVTNCTFDSSNALRNAVAIRGGTATITNNTFVGASSGDGLTKPDMTKRLNHSDGFEYAVFLYGGNCTVAGNDISGYDSIINTELGYYSAGITTAPYYSLDATITGNNLHGNSRGMDLVGSWHTLSDPACAEINDILLTTSSNAFIIGENMKKANTFLNNTGGNIALSLDQNDCYIPSGSTIEYGPPAYFDLFMTSGTTDSSSATLNFETSDGAKRLIANHKTFGIEVSEDGATWKTATLKTALNSTSTSAIVTGLSAGKTYKLRAVLTINAKTRPVGSVADVLADITIYSSLVTVTTPTPIIGDSTPTQTGSKVVEVNGEKQDAGNSTTVTTPTGQKQETIKVDDTKLETILETKGDKPTVTLPANKGSDVVVGELTGQTVKNMEKKEAVLEIKTETVSYTLPASQINIDSVSSQIGSQVQLKDIKVSVKIAEPSADTVKVVENTASKGNCQIVVKPVEFEITCISGGKTVEVSKFNGYVERTVAIPDGVDPSKITTGIVLNSDGTFSHVPTTILNVGGKYFAKINSLTNSTYSVIYNPVTFADVSNHWAKSAINDMGSRMVVTGVGISAYEPERSITRAEFAAISVRALGLKKGSTESAFADVSASDWFNGYVDKATEYGLITGYDSKSYGPNDTITREQAMAIIVRAMKLTGMKISLTDSEVSTLLAGYKDSSSVSDYAKASVATCIKAGLVTGTTATTISPKAYVTRAEVAVMVQRLLQKSGLI